MRSALTNKAPAPAVVEQVHVQPLWRRDMDLELAHEPKEVGPLEPQCPCRPRAVAARLGQGRLDEPPLEVADGAVEAHW